MSRLSPFLLFALVLLSACRPTPPAPTPPAPPVEPDPTTEPIPATPAAAPTGTAGSVAVTATPETEVAASIFDVDPADRTVYAAGLTATEADALAHLPGAPVYHMAITIDESMSAVSGRQTVTYTNLENATLEDVYFHLHPNTLDGAITVADVTVDSMPVTAAETDGDVLRVPLPSPLAPGDVVTIDMTFETAVPTDIGRNYGVLAYYEDILALAHFYPMLSVYNDEGWNITAPDIQGDLTYSDAGFYLVQVTAPDNVVIVATGSEVDRASGAETQTVTYALGPARDFYLAAGDFTEVSATAGETTIRSYAPAKLAGGAALALDVAAAALAEFDERLAPYPYSELDIVTTPTSALGIEYPGLIVGTLRMYNIGSETQGGVPYEAILESTTAHEVAHQWFYNIIGNDQLDEPWLDEAMAGYTTYRYFADRYGQQVGDNYFETFYGRWDRVDGAEIPVGMPVAAYDEMEYGAIVYGRGPVFVRELEETLGREAFDAFMRAYAAKFRWEEGTTEAFRALAEEQCGCDLGQLFADWVYK